MKALNVFAPHIVYGIGLILLYLIYDNLFKNYLSNSRTILVPIFVVLWCCYTALFLTIIARFPPNRWISATPSNNWQQQAAAIDTVIILGFGYEEDECGAMEPGATNEGLLNWALDNTQAKTLLVQEGVWVAACESDEKTCKKSGRQIQRIHKHCPNQYLNTFDTAYCTMYEMEKLDKTQAVLVAHPLQLKRAMWDFEAVKAAKASWQDFIFIIPEISNVSYPADSVHWHTRNERVWRVMELLVARPRDFLSPIPDRCKAPLREP